MRSSGTVEPAVVEWIDGDAPRLISELFDRAEDDRWREVVIVTHTSSCKDSMTQRLLSRALCASSWTIFDGLSRAGGREVGSGWNCVWSSSFVSLASKDYQQCLGEQARDRDRNA